MLGEVNISSYNLQFIPLAEDVVSLENDNAFKEIWVVRLHLQLADFTSHVINQDGDETSIYNSAQALVTLQRLFGPFPRILGKGNFAFVSLEMCEEPLLISPPPSLAALTITRQGVHPSPYKQRPLDRPGQV